MGKTNHSIILKLNFSESETVEFKNSLSEMDQILETISAFSNTKSGIIYIGVADDGLINGVTLGKGTLENLANEIKLNTDPRIFPNLATEKFESRTIIKLTVQEYPIKPVWTRDKVFIRVGKTNQKITAEKIREMISQNTPFHWDKQIIPNLTIAGINEDDVKSFVSLSNEERNSAMEAARDIKSYLERLNLIQDEKLTNASILLFGKNPQKYFPRSIVKCAKFAGNEPVNFIDMQDVSGTIIGQVPTILNFIRKHINISVDITGKPQRDEIWDYPKEALREAVINAICHRNYEDTGNVQIRIFDDRIEIWNPGTLPAGITLKSLTENHRSLPRNELIARCFYLIKYIEQWGTGTNRMISFCRTAGLKDPKFEVKDNDFVVTLYKSIKQAKVVELPFKLNDSQKKLIRYLIKHKKAKTSEIQKHLQISVQLVRRYLNDLSAVLIWSGKTKTDPTGEYSLRAEIDINKLLEE
jgi:ATP-dependent DNA helicase RecG